MIVLAKIVIDLAKCKGCGECANICPHEMYQVKDGKVAVVKDMSECGACLVCARTCDSGAITVVK